MNPFFVTDFSISDSLKTVRKSVLIYETIINRPTVNINTERMEPFPKPDDLNRLLPWSDELPEGFRTKKKK